MPGISDEGRAALIEMAVEVGGIVIRRIFDAITENDEASWKALDDILPDNFQVKLALIRGEEKARHTIKDALAGNHP